MSENAAQLERVDGVAVFQPRTWKSLCKSLDQDKIDAVNDKLLVKVSDRLADAKKKLDDNKRKSTTAEELDDAQAQLDAGKSS
ncbi:MAG: hypothetical protein ACLUFT_11610 [Gemmiger formicilis]|uniref:hypothetical protein n=1 Tax=Gemmiger formicilis TaxID=745368 RepID=UPI003995192A